MFPSAPKGSKLKRFVIAIMLGLVVVTTPVAILLTPRPAQAQFGGIVFDPSVVGAIMKAAAAKAIADGIVVSKTIWDKLWEAAKWTYEHGAATAFRNMARTYTQKIAYDSANMLASGGKGQTPLFSWKNLGKSISDAGDEAAGSFLDGIASGGVWGKFNICEPTGPDAPFAKLMITLPTFYEQKPIQPSCTLSKFKANWNKVLTDPEAKKNFLKDFAVVLDPKQNELGLGLQVQTNVIKDVELNKELKKLQESQWGGFLPVTQTITDFIRTPAPRIERAANMTTEQALKEPLVFTGDILADALGVFTNTLAAKLMKRLMEGDIPNPAGIGPSSLFGAAYGASGVDYAQSINATLLTAPLAGGDVLDVISQFSGCPDDIRYAAINNCTIDGKFEQALRKAEEGSALTVAEAVNKGLLNGSWVFKQEKPHNVRLPDAWYLSDVKKLRLARILPLGWELAAQKVSGQDISLNDVMKGFADTASPYYHLIDPNWVLKAPQSQCRLRGPGQILQSEGAGRYDTCVDVQNCVAENEDGTCASWGYCTKEKNIWRLGGDSCEFPVGSGSSPYASCQTFTAPTGEQVSYLQNSLANFDDGVCSGAAGCKWYSTSFSGAAGSVASGRYSLNNYCSNDPKKACISDSACGSGGRCLNSRLYLKNLDNLACDAKNEGCTQFLRLSNINSSLLSAPPADSNIFAEVVKKVTAPNSADTYDKYASVQAVSLRSAPNYLNCYDSDPRNDSPECKNYLTMCKAEEVGCDLYTPKDGSPAIPGVFKTENTCPAQCVGYQTYQQQPSFFENNPPAEQNFIPKTAKKCSAEAVGCEEFTNVSQNEQREYYSGLKQCIKPGPEAATYFTWVGSDLTGYQLKKYSLKSAAGAVGPAVTDKSDEAPSNPNQTPSKCRGGTNDPAEWHADFLTDPDCKEFYDVTGAVSYRKLSATITASDNCNKYRATSVAQSDCTATSGLWEGGKCFYNAIPGEGKKCSAPQVGCREFKGSTGDNVKLVFPLSTFGDSDAKTAWSVDATPASGWRSGTPSNDASVAFGHSFDSGADKIIYKDVADNSITIGQQYVISFWAKKSSLPVAAGRVKGVAVQPIVPSVAAIKDWWAGVKKDWSQVPGAQAQTAGNVTFTAQPPEFKNESFQSSWKTSLEWSAATAPTDEVTVGIDNGVMSSTTYKADWRCSPGPHYDEPCDNDDTCRDLTPACILDKSYCRGTGFKVGQECPNGNSGFCQDNNAFCNATEYKCKGGWYDGAVCSGPTSSSCSNSTAVCSNGVCSNKTTTQGLTCKTDAECRFSGVCEASKKACSNKTATKGLTCDKDSDCRFPQDYCNPEKYKCDGGLNPGSSCNPQTKYACVNKTPVCNKGTLTDKKGTVSVNLPTRKYADYTLPISQTYTLNVSYRGGSTVTKQAVVKVNNPPGSFNIVSPLAGATNQSITPTIVWQASQRALNYEITFAGANGSSHTVSANGCGDNCNFTLPTINKLKNDNSYTVTIKASNEDGYSAVPPYPSVKFTTAAAAAGEFAITSPADDPNTTNNEDERESIPVTGSVVGWSPSANATSYIVTLYLKETQGMILKWTDISTSAVDMPIPAGTLKYDTDCQIEVTALSGAASQKVSLSPCHTQQPPKPATLSSPQVFGGTAIIKTVNPEFRWVRGLWNKTYDLEIQQAGGAGYLDYCKKTGLAVQYIISPDLTAACGKSLVGGNGYRWRIISHNPHPNTAVTDWANFRVDLYENKFGGSGVGYAELPKVIGSNKNILVPPEPKGLSAELSGQPGEYAKCDNPVNPPVITGKQNYTVDLKWNAYVNPTGDNKALGFTLYRGLAGRAVEYLGCFGPSEVCTDANKKLDGFGANSYPDKDTNPAFSQKDGNRIVYQLRTFNAGGESKGISVAVATPNPPLKPSCVPTVSTPDKGNIIIKLMVDGQPAAGVSSYELNSAKHADVPISTSGDKIYSLAPGDYLFNYLGGSLTGFTNAEIYSIEAAPGGSINCVGTPCGDVQGILQAGQTLTYTVNLVAPTPQATAKPNSNLDFSIAGGLSSDWQLYTFGPVELPTGADINQGVRVSISAGARFVIDNIALQQVADTVYVNKNSWVIPQDETGNLLCGVKKIVENGVEKYKHYGDNYIGCKAYTDRQRATYNLTGFSKICRAEAVGCEALVDTRNSNSARETVATVNSQTVYTPSDQLVYRVYDTAKACAANLQACQRVGAPNLGTTGQVISWGDKFVRLDPDSYSTSASPLCSAQQDKCEAYKAGSVSHSFKDPGNNVCEYKQLTPASQYGWYKQGTSEPCNLLANASFENWDPHPPVCLGGNKNGLACKTDNDCNGGGICDKQADFKDYWNRNGSSSGASKAESRLYALPSFGQGYYDGNTVLKIVSAAQAYSGVWSKVVELSNVVNAPRYFTVSAHLYVPAGATMATSWILSQHAYNGDEPTPANCPKRLVNGVNINSCHHYEYEPNEPGNDYTVTEADKGKWVYKSATIKVDPGTKYLSVGIIVGTGWANGEPDPATYKAGQEIYVDGVSLTEGSAPYAYICPSEMSSCKAYRDPVLTNKVYYYLDNNKLDRTACSGKVSEKDGCLLLNDLSQTGDLSWSANETYERSRSQDDNPVAPESGRGRCSNDANCDYTGNGSTAPDTNLLLKVRRDRVCAEWLSCQTSTTITDPQTGKTREICYSLGRCDQASGSKAAGQCANWVEPEPQQHPLDEADYVGRNVTWSGNEYSGYSIPGLCSLDMVSSTPACGFSVARAKACRVYPEGDSPFPANVARFDSENAATAKIVNKSEGYKDANVCQPGENCECNYQRAGYKNGEIKFFGYKSTPPDPINKITDTTIDCRTPSNEDQIEKCNEQSKLKQVTLARGLRGYCLETDASRRINAGKSEACMTWLPIDAIQGETSIFDDEPKAGFTPQRTDGNLLYCLQANGNADRNKTGTDKYLVKSKQKGRKVQIESISEEPGMGGRNGVGTSTTDLSNTKIGGVFSNDWGNVVYKRMTDLSNTKISGVFSTDTADDNLRGRVDHIFKFSVSLSDFERAVGGLDAIDSVHIEYYFGDNRHFRNGYSDENNKAEAINLSRLVLNRKEQISSCVKGYYDCGLEVTFNPTNEDKFLTFVLTDTNDGDATFTIGIHLYLREWCSGLAQVVDKQQTIPNKAQTNRVFAKSSYDIKSAGLGYKYQTDKLGNPITSPFGAVLDSPLEQSDKIVYVHQTPNPSTMFPAKTDNDFHSSAGAIYSCRTDRTGFACGQWMCQVNGPEKSDGRIDPDKLGKACTVAAKVSSYCGVTPACPDGQTCGGKYLKDQPYMCTGTNPAIIIPGSDGVAVPADKLYTPLQEIFTKVYKKYIWSGKCSNGSDCSKNDDCADKKCNLAYYAANDAIPNDDI
ncbi:MAG: hypothetical protein HY973_01315, partial [Candidatus Kerfeldbacteria bacterium]|nr:hypothetical protein [Candidatus Kerfeldbacteria bacterium]